MIGMLVGLLASVWGWYLLPGNLSLGRRLGLAPLWGLSVTGLLWYLFWLADLNWMMLSLLWFSGAFTLSLYAVGNVFRINHYQSPSQLVAVIKTFIEKSFKTHDFSLKKWLSKITAGEIVVLSAASLSTIVIILWNLLMRGVVWDALVLYDWRGLRIADGWRLLDFFQQFTGHPEFYAYDFSHPFLDSLWRGLVFAIGGEVSTGMYLVVFAGLLIYSYQVLADKQSWWWLLLLLVATPQMLVTWTQGYAALPYSLWWGVVLLISLDDYLGVYKQTWLLLMLMLATMLLRVSEPFWLVFALLWSLKIWWSDLDWKTKFAISIYWLVPLLAVFGHWQMLQQEAVSYSAVSEVIKEASRSSYDLNKYADFFEIVTTSLWWGQTLWLLLAKNQAASYSLLAGFFGVIGWWQERSSHSDRLGKQDWWLLLLGITWWLMLAAALLFEISADPENWLGKQRLLARVSLPLSMWGIIVSARWWKKLNQH